jgi:hypothetical protein
LPYSHQLIGTAGKLRSHLPFTRITGEWVAAWLPCFFFPISCSDLWHRKESHGYKGTISQARLCSKVTCTDQMDGNVISKHPRATWMAAPQVLCYLPPSFILPQVPPITFLALSPSSVTYRMHMKAGAAPEPPALLIFPLAVPRFLASSLSGAVILYTLVGRVKHNIVPAP